ncbi:ATG7 [Lepeophtheirus salmonis]|uniref:ATG7 n=1 Tax=Lepeophtheirus salmonis TaxID=72036 RepID=A0A7R8CPF8_LEPSM|nr:ATG7 [Lepeophtheirus salmonis]CAF2849005.1 ATG7 [Lepeophtheirus salmonis]
MGMDPIALRAHYDRNLYLQRWKPLPPYVPYTVGRPIGSEYIAQNICSKKSPPKRTWIDSDTMITLNNSRDEYDQEDEEIRRLENVSSFLPIMRGSSRDPDILERLDVRGFNALVQRYSNHLRYTSKIIKRHTFVPFDSRVNPDFWLSLSKIKLEVLKLKDEAYPVVGRVELTNRGKDIPPILDMDRFSFDKDQSNDVTSIFSQGFICNQNTIEKFKNIDKSELLENTCGQQLRESIMNGSALDNPSQHLGSFLILTFADLKKYNFYFWFSFPGFQMPSELRIVSCEPAPDFTIPKESFATYFAIINGNYSENVKEAVQMFNETDHDIIFGYLDSCTYENKPGMVLEELFISYSISFSWKEDYQSDVDKFELGSVVGWEKERKWKTGSSMESCTRFGFGYTFKIKSSIVGIWNSWMQCCTRVVLVGESDTLLLLTIPEYPFQTLRDKTLFDFNDCLEGGQHKAKCARHPISDSNLEESKKNFEELDKLIQSHDIVFLLTDSRESRWLPTVMGAHYEKIVMNAALGFDTFLVMRHGMSPKKYLVSGNNDPQIPGDSLGCYFCNDVVAPGDSLKDRTLDQQCTVTRPGMSFQAAAIVVELAVSMIQHKKKGFAPAGTQDSESVLGLVPHSIRGSMNTFSQFCPTTSAFDRCTACSHMVLKEFAENRFQFIQKVCNSSSYIEDITGLSTLLSGVNLDDIVALNSDSEEE